MKNLPTPLSNKLLFTINDPSGISVSLEKDCWYGHILKRHMKQMSHRLSDVKSTIAYPDKVHEKLVNNVKNRVYFKHWKDRDPLGQEVLKVPTEEIVKGKVARVLTAHPLPFFPKS